MSNYKYIIDFIANTRKFNTDVSDTGNIVRKTMTSIGTAVGVGFSVAGLISFGKNLVDISEKGKWVERAFQRIGDAKLLDDLNKATLNEVDNLSLMQRTIQANNFKIPLTELGNLFKFATIRAKETGESVDYLTQSIILGIGRKSPLILDNLGISAVELRKRLGGVSAEAADIGDITKIVGQIATEELKKMGEAADDTSVSVASIEKQWEDWKLKLSQSGDFKKYMQGTLQELDAVSKIAFTESLSGWQKFTSIVFSSTDKWKEIASTIGETRKEITYADEDSAEYRNTVSGFNNVIAKQVTTFGDLKQQIKEKTELLEKADVTDTAYIKTLYKEIEALEKRKKAFEDLAKPVPKREEAPGVIQTKGLDSINKLDVNSRTKLWSDERELASIEPWKKQQEKHLEELTKKWYDYQENVTMVADAVGQGFADLGYSIVDSLGLAKSGFEGFVGGLADTVVQLISMMLANSIANAIAGATISGTATGPAAIFTTPAFISTAVGGVLAAFAAIPKFAEGGIAYGPTLGIMGEYPGAKSNPEVIAPLSKLKGMINNNQNITLNLSPGVKIDRRGMTIFIKEANFETDRVR